MKWNFVQFKLLQELCTLSLNFFTASIPLKALNTLKWDWSLNMLITGKDTWLFDITLKLSSLFKSNSYYYMKFGTLWLNFYLSGLMLSLLLSVKRLVYWKPFGNLYLYINTWIVYRLNWLSSTTSMFSLQSHCWPSKFFLNFYSDLFLISLNFFFWI